jgi:hypothetical protein
VKIRVLQNFSQYEAGQVFEDWPGGMCEILIGRGLIEEIKEPAVVEAAVEERSVETADASPKIAKKKVK